MQWCILKDKYVVGMRPDTRQYVIQIHSWRKKLTWNQLKFRNVRD